MEPNQLAAWAGAAIATAGALEAFRRWVWAPGRNGIGAIRRWFNRIDDTLAFVGEQLTENGGTTLRDKVDKLLLSVDTHTQQFENHLARHAADDVDRLQRQARTDAFQRQMLQRLHVVDGGPIDLEAIDGSYDDQAATAAEG